MPELDPQMAAILKRIEALGGQAYNEMTPLQARAEQERRNAHWNENPLPVQRVDELDLQGAFGARWTRLYDDRPDAGRRPAILYFHGGGWVVGSPQSHDCVGRALARGTGLPVFSYDYVMAPEHPFPDPIDDCVAAFRSLAARAGAFDVDPKRIGIAGDSAGAALALNVAMAQRGSSFDAVAPMALALVYPAASMTTDRASHKLFGTDDYFLSTDMMAWFWQQYVPDPAHKGDPRIELAQADLRGIPATYFSVAEFDPLIDEGHELFDKLCSDGCEVEYSLWRGVTHASLPMGRDLDQSHRFLAEISDFFRRRLGF